MAQVFGPEANFRVRAAIVVAVAVVVGGVASIFAYQRTDGAWNVGETIKQPIPFRHDLHSGRLGIDCRYCHSSVERAAFAGMPSAQTCMTCHSQVWKGATVLEPIRTSLALDQPIVWNAVHRLPSHTYFHHGIHVSKGVACETCHGAVWTMKETKKVKTLSMSWCLECHRDPAPNLRPPEAVHAREWNASEPREAVELLHAYGIATDRLTDCSTCHR